MSVTTIQHHDQTNTDHTPNSHRPLAYVHAGTPILLTVLTIFTENYMEHPRHYDMDHTPGALNLGQTTATRMYCGFFIVYFTSPVFIAPLADNHLGQYKTLLISLVVYALGCVALVVSSLPVMLDRGAGLPGLIIAMVLIALGGGGVSITISESYRVY